MQNITINNHGIINIYGEDLVSQAKDKLLTKLYHARHKETMGGYEAWHKLLDMYYMGNYEGMREFIISYKGRGGRTRNECIHYLDIIMNGGN